MQNKLAQFDPDKLFSNALNKSQMYMAAHHGGTPTSAIAAAITGLKDPFDHFQKGYQESLGKVQAAQEAGPAKWHGALSILPTIAGIAGAGYLVKHFYDRWKSGQVSDMLMKDPELSHLNQHDLANSISVMRDVSPSLARNPIIAKAFVKRMAQFGSDVSVKDVKEMLDAEKVYGESHGLGSYAGPVGDVIGSVI